MLGRLAGPRRCPPNSQLKGKRKEDLVSYKTQTFFLYQLASRSQILSNDKQLDRDSVTCPRAAFAHSLYRMVSSTQRWGGRTAIGRHAPERCRLRAAASVRAAANARRCRAASRSSALHASACKSVPACLTTRAMSQ